MHPSVIAHIAGPSGSGKTTLLHEIKRQFPHYSTVDIDEFDEAAEKNLGYQNTRKNNYSDAMLSSLNAEKQRILNAFIAKNKNVVLAGHHTEGGYHLNIPTTNRFMLSTSPRVSAYRAFEREKGQHPGHERLESEIPADIRENQKIVKELRGFGYKRVGANDVLEYLRNLQNKQSLGS